jgi:phosphoribosylglycinamide formyltransferase-1
MRGVPVPISIGEPLLAADDSRKLRLLEICVALPETTSKGERHLVMQVRGKSFVWLLDNHHDDGRVALACKVMPGENQALAEANPARYFVPPYLGANGWTGLRLDTGAIDWDEVTDLVHSSYRLIAPQRLARLVE